MSIFVDNIKINRSFKSFFERKDIIDELKKIEYDLLKNKSYNYQFYPLPNEVLRFATLNLDDVRYVILGMDPYPSDFVENGVLMPIATGRSFEVRSLKSWLDNFKQSSLQNILKALYVNEKNNFKSNTLKYNSQKNVGKKANKLNIPTLNNIRKEIKNGTFKILSPRHLWDNFEKNGTMFLNSTLTVKPHLSNSHTTYWTYFMDELIKYIILYRKKNEQNNIKWFVWGENAKNRVGGFVDKKDIIYTCHPASRVNNTFVRDNCFQYMEEIDIYRHF